MNKKLFFFFLLFMPTLMCRAQKVYTTYLWHLQQPIYWPDKSLSNPFHYQNVKQSQDIKNSGGNQYGTGQSHPLNNLQAIFGKDDRVNAYQYSPKDAVQSVLSYPDAGAQVNYSGCLIENVNSLANAGQWGYAKGWRNNFITARKWKTSGGKPRMDIMGFTYDHALSPLVSTRALAKEIEAHRYIYGKTFGTSPDYSKGYWPAEDAFSERIIEVLVKEGFQWTVVTNSHLSRTLSDFPVRYGTSGTNINPPNKADKVPAKGVHYWSGQIDGRGGTFAVPYSYQAHKAKYVDPNTGEEYKITVVPMADLLSYQDGYAPMSTHDITQHILPYSNASHPSLVLLAHDGDNAFAGGYSYYHESVPDFVAAVSNNKEMKATTIQQFLADHPVPDTDVVHVEDGSWVNAANDWGSPQFINWLWPLYNKSTYTFNPNGWTEDARNWAVITAIDNYVCMAEDLEDNRLRIGKIVDADSLSTPAELAWQFYLPALTSGYMYYGKALDMEVKQTIAGNNAIYYALKDINAHSGTDHTPPSVFIPQRFPYNPGSAGFGPLYGYKEFINSRNFTVWTYAFDVSGISTAILKYRLDKDGANPINNNDNETYQGGPGVSGWKSVPMSEKVLSPENVTHDPEIDFFVLPYRIANLYYAEIKGLSDTLVDYYVSVTDTKGNTFNTPIQHVYVGNETAGSNSNNHSIIWTPENPNRNDIITITDSAATSHSFLHWGVTVDGADWIAPVSEYQPAGTIPFSSQAVETPFTDVDKNGVYSVKLGPFNNPKQVVQKIDFVVKTGNTWDNNNGKDYYITISSSTSNNPMGKSFTVTVAENGTYHFSDTDFYFVANDSASFAGIVVVSTVDKGLLSYDGTQISDSAYCANVQLLSYSPPDNQSGSPLTSFRFKVKDSKNRISDNVYTATINVTDNHPTGADSLIMLSENSIYRFYKTDIPFHGTANALLSGIQVVRTTDKGSLMVSGAPVRNGSVISNIGALTFTTAKDETGVPYTSFSYKLMASDGTESDSAYRMEFNVIPDFTAGVHWFPQHPTASEKIIIAVKDDKQMTGESLLHWGVNGVDGNWQEPDAAYRPKGSALFNGSGSAVETKFIPMDSTLYFVELGPFDNPAQPIQSVNFVIRYNTDSWNNNNGQNWNIPVSPVTGIKKQQTQKPLLYPNPVRQYAQIDLTGFEGQYVVSVYAVSGRLISRTEVMAPVKFYFRRQNLSSGNYLLLVKEKKTKKVLISKFIIK